MYCWSRIKQNIIYYLVLYSLSNQTHISLPEVNECLCINANTNVSTLFIQNVQLFPLEILDFFNDFLKYKNDYNWERYRKQRNHVNRI